MSYVLSDDELEFIQVITIRCQKHIPSITVEGQIEAMRKNKEFCVYGTEEDYNRMLEIARKLRI